ncbi:hypothetical protein HDU67_002952 [Dinochytrium kinnereticum]|nr:hypothetical protein HDU67_002952 [Dinochytrium kinnereticum]
MSFTFNSSNRMWRVIPAIALATAGLGFWTHTVLKGVDAQRSSSPIIKGVIFHLRHNKKMEELLGSDIQIDKKQQFKGKVNHFKGHADVEFRIVGSKGDGDVFYKGRRTQPDVWTSEVFDVVVGGEKMSMRE